MLGEGKPGRGGVPPVDGASQRADASSQALEKAPLSPNVLAGEILMVGPASVPNKESLLTKAGRQRVSCRHVPTWEAFRAQAEQRSEAALLLAFCRHHSECMPILRRFRDVNTEIPIWLVTPSGSGDEFAAAAGQIAEEVFPGSIAPSALDARLRRMFQVHSEDTENIRGRLLKDLASSRLLGRDPRFVQAISLVPRFARAELSVLITGETGTGKELCARALHHLGRRRANPFVTVDCCALPEQLFESELFGHVKGAFTGADREHRGLVAAAEGGTLFLDEIDSLSLPAQAKLLRLLQERTYRPVGSDRSHVADIRLIGATNRDLTHCVETRTFRRDLLFRLNVLQIYLPPLRERPLDIEFLAMKFLDDCRDSVEDVPRAFSSSALQALRAHAWPGNIRELLNAVQRAAVICEGGKIGPADLGLVSGKSSEPEARPVEPKQFRAARDVAIARFEKSYLLNLLRRHGGNVTHAAVEAAQDRRALGRLLKKYGITREAIGGREDLILPSGTL